MKSERVGRKSEQGWCRPPDGTSPVERRLTGTSPAAVGDRWRSFVRPLGPTPAPWRRTVTPVTREMKGAAPQKFSRSAPEFARTGGSAGRRVEGRRADSGRFHGSKADP